MTTAKIAITIEEQLLNQLDSLVKRHIFPNRSKAIQEAVRDKLGSLGKNRLAKECANLDPKFEQALADEGLTKEKDEWPEYWEEISSGPILIPLSVTSSQASDQF